MFGAALPELAANRTVIAVDLQGHGRTPLGKRPFDLESMGDDMAALSKRLGYPKLDVVGYSLGGGVRPAHGAAEDRCRARAGAGVDCVFGRRLLPDIKAQQVQVSARLAPTMKDAPMYESYVALAPTRQSSRDRETLSKNRLAIRPDLTHYDIFASPRLVTTVLPFSNGPSDAKSWAEQVRGAKLIECEGQDAA